MEINVNHNLRERLRAKREHQKRELLLLLGVLAVVVGGWLYYSFALAPSPERTLEQLQTAVKKHDRQQLEQLIDKESMLTELCRELTNSLVDGDLSLSESRRKQYFVFYKKIRPQLVQGLDTAVTGFVEQGQWPAPQGRDLLKGRDLGVDFERLLERSKLRTTEVLSFSPPVKEDKLARTTLRVRETGTKLEYELKLTLTKQESGLWQVTAIHNYRDYLEAVLAKQNKAIADYVAATVDTVQQSNGRLGVLEARYTAIVKRAAGHYGPNSISALEELINGEIIPCLKARQASLDAVPPPPGAEYLAGLRQRSTELDIAAWQHFLKGLAEHERDELDLANTLKKQTLTLELRIEDIIKRRANSPALPQLN